LKKNIILVSLQRKAVFALAGVFLAIALVVPPLIFVLQADRDLDNIIVIRDNPAQASSGNVTITDETSENHTTNLIIAGIIYAVFIPLFAVTLYYGINHPRPDLKKGAQPPTEINELNN
jgi:hypothetical protein